MFLSLLQLGQLFVLTWWRWCERCEKPRRSTRRPVVAYLSTWYLWCFFSSCFSKHEFSKIRGFLSGALCLIRLRMPARQEPPCDACASQAAEEPPRFLLYISLSLNMEENHMTYFLTLMFFTEFSRRSRMLSLIRICCRARSTYVITGWSWMAGGVLLIFTVARYFHADDCLCGCIVRRGFRREEEATEI